MAFVIGDYRNMATAHTKFVDTDLALAATGSAITALMSSFYNTFFSTSAPDDVEMRTFSFSQPAPTPNARALPQASAASLALMAPPKAVVAKSPAPFADFALLRKVMNSCTKLPLKDGEILPILECALQGAQEYVKGKTNKIARSVLKRGGRYYLLMTHCKKGQDRLLGSGGFKKAKYAVDLITGWRRVVAIFDKRKQNKEAYDLARREVEIMTKCQGIKNVVHLYDAFETDDKIYMVMEECNGGELFDRFTSAPLGNHCRLNIAIGIARAFEEIHRLGIIHRDLKAENIFLVKVYQDALRKRFEFHPKVADFGLACYEAEDRAARAKPSGSSHWLSREFAHCLLTSPNEERVVALTTKKRDMEALAYLIFILFHSYHQPMTFQTLESAEESWKYCAALLNPKALEKELQRLYRPELAKADPVYAKRSAQNFAVTKILSGIFQKNWGAKEVVAALESLRPVQAARAVVVADV